MYWEYVPKFEAGQIRQGEEDGNDTLTHEWFLINIWKQIWIKQACTFEGGANLIFHTLSN